MITDCNCSSHLISSSIHTHSHPPTYYMSNATPALPSPHPGRRFIGIDDNGFRWYNDKTRIMHVQFFSTHVTVTVIPQFIIKHPYYEIWLNETHSFRYSILCVFDVRRLKEFVMVFKGWKRDGQDQLWVDTSERIENNLKFHSKSNNNEFIIFALANIEWYYGHAIISCVYLCVCFISPSHAKCHHSKHGYELSNWM